MKIGLQVYYFEWPGSPSNTSEKLIEIAKTADSYNFQSLWVMDHFIQLGPTAFGPSEISRLDGPILEAYSTLTHLAAVTRHVKLGVMVTNNVFRHPSVLIKTVSTLDVLSGGRAYLGIGAGVPPDTYEVRGLGGPKYSVSERFKRLKETLQIAKHMWNNDQSAFDGKFYLLEKPIHKPQPLSQPHPPILIGGDGERTLLQLIARYADALNFHIGGPVEGYPSYINEWYNNRRERLTRKFNKLKIYCDRIGRDYEDIERTVLATIKIAPEAMSISEVVDLCKELADLGVQHVIFNMPNMHEIKPIEIIGQEIIPLVSEM